MRIVIIDQFSITPYDLKQQGPVYVADFEPGGRLYEQYVADGRTGIPSVVRFRPPVPDVRVLTEAVAKDFTPELCTTVLREPEPGAPVEVWRYNWDSSG